MITTPPIEKQIQAGDVTYRCITSQLDCVSTEDLLPEVLNIITGEGGIGKALGGGRLRAILPKLLATTSVLVPTGPGGALEKIDVGSEEGRNRAFTLRMKLWRAVILWTLEVNFADFLPEGGVAALATRTLSN